MIENCQELVNCLEKNFKKRINITVVCLEASVIKGTLDNISFSIIYIPNEYLYFKTTEGNGKVMDEFKTIYERESYGTNPICSYELENNENQIEKIVEWSKYPESRIEELRAQEENEDDQIKNLKIYYQKNKIKVHAM